MPIFKKIENCSKELGLLASAQNLVCATAESCTGGMVASAITAIPGSSGWFDRGFVTYSNAAKSQMLGVSESSLNAYGAVSESVVLEMAEGAVKHSLAQLSVAISGVAGPAGGSKEKPVGTVCFAWSHQAKNTTYTLTRLLDGDREQIRQQACVFALEGLIALLDGHIVDYIRN
jgi:nicotinamide-nucleotide amidase